MKRILIAGMVIGHALAFLCGNVLLEAAVAQSNGECAPDDPDHPDYTSAVVWRGPQPELDLEDIVTLTAPILWYSADEPLILKNDTPLPHAHPCDAPSDQGVVYYQVVKVHLRGSERVTIPEQDDPRFFEKVDDFTVRYYFYYHEDIGMNSHTHDLEVTELEIALQQTDAGCYQVRVIRVSAFAHGTDWYTNELILKKDTRMPITLFVEEGKHATCPDRNADGVYTPGYDVNVRINDAWGVRDVFGSGWLISPGYNAAMTKRRYPMFRAFPPESPYAAEALHPFYSAFRDKAENAEHYVLRAANTVTMCEDIPHGDFLLDMMTRHKFGSGNEPVQYESGSVRALAEPLEGVGKLPSVNLRWDRDLGFSFAWGGFGIETYYLVPRVTWIIENSQWSYEAMIMKSASRFLENYISVGAAYERDWRRQPNGDIIVEPHNEWNFVTEIGVKFRVRLSGKLRVITLGNSFGGIRFGLRWSGFDSLKNGRMIAEIGTGVW